MTTQKSNSKIINGRFVTADDDFSKHIVGIYKNGATMCTGVLVAEGIVLTAAHCIDEARKGKISFGFQNNKLQFLPITEFIQHPQYDESIVGIVDHAANDVMVVKFKGVLPLGYATAAISDANLVQDGNDVMVTGYGRDEDDLYDVLKVTNVKVVEAVDYEFRTDEKKTGSCDGDSGGPVFYKNADGQNILVGLVSRGDENCQQYGIYENMTYYKNWIKESIQKLN